MEECRTASGCSRMRLKSLSFDTNKVKCDSGDRQGMDRELAEKWKGRRIGDCQSAINQNGDLAAFCANYY